MGNQLSLFGFESELKIVSSFDRNPIVAYEYFLLISPSASIKQEVKALKNKLNEKIGMSNENVNSVPHISLLLLRENSNLDTFITEKVKHAAASFDGFNILINGAHKFEHPYTADLVLKVESDEINKLQTSLCHAFNLRAPKSFVPHITIGRGIPKNKFEKIGTDFSDFDLREDFLCSSVTVLKRKVEISARETKRSSYVKIFEAPLNSGIIVKESILRTA